MIFKRLNGWCEQSAAALLPLIDLDVQSFINSQIEQGGAQLYRVTGDCCKAWLLISFEHYPSGTELVLEAIQGTGANAVTKAVMDWAKKSGVKSVRFQTHHGEKVAERLIKGTGLERVASVFRCEL